MIETAECLQIEVTRQFNWAIKLDWCGQMRIMNMFMKLSFFLSEDYILP